uniref:Uncharacterized protein n=1 Tax=Myoviridae sp. ctCL221 TaxID=2826630 RepID=A0A8S5M6B3_9CAUD|nr:MAG TPA: hypothetical protein [Myoviridae sp. ctCL221]
MLKIMLLIILSPLAILCGIFSIAIIYAILNKIIEIITDRVKTIINLTNNRDDNQC